MQAQFTFKGTIDNYAGKRALLKLNTAFDGVVAGTITTDASGKFSIPIKEKYTGVLTLSLLDAKQDHIFISDNTNIDFKASLDSDNQFYLIDAGNALNTAYRNYLSYNNKKTTSLPQLETLINSYKPSDAFYSQIQAEIKNINSLPESDYTKYPYLAYYIPASKLAESLKKNNTKDYAAAKEIIIEQFANSGEEFETSGLGKGLLYNYFVLSTTGISSADQENKIDQAVQTLLDEAGEETSRGQEILAAAIDMLISYGVDKVAEKYMAKAQSMTCEITPELKETLAKNNNIKVGKIIPNVAFTHKLAGKYNSLYDIKTSYKLILVWASWCSHCQQEMPYVKQFYDRFKKSGGEIIALSVDYSKEDWEKAIVDFTWLNDSELLGWDSDFVKTLNISGTPTLILVDNNNKILKITSRISEIANTVK
jgi:thiol-disulfide isomerase/thioredoxin